MISYFIIFLVSIIILCLVRSTLVDKPNLTQSDTSVISPVCDLRNMINIVQSIMYIAITVHNNRITWRKSSFYKVIFIDQEYNRTFIRCLWIMVVFLQYKFSSKLWFIVMNTFKIIFSNKIIVYTFLIKQIFLLK